MAKQLQKLELTWIGKGNDHKLEPRILIEDPEKSYGNPMAKNMLIQGDNLLALKALEQEYAGRVKCVFIDPPYNTGNAFEHYDDGVEHSLWLNLMKPRVELLYRLLSENGSLWITIDDNEVHYLKVMCDEIFGRKNFVRNIVWQKKYAAANDAKGIPDAHDHILVYQKTAKFNRNLLPRTEKQNSLYKYDSNDGMGLWRSDNLSVKTYSKEYDFPIQNPNTLQYYNPPNGRAWLTNKITMQKWIEEKRVFFGQKGTGAPQLKRYLKEVQDGVLATSWWTHEECGHNDESRKESKIIFGNLPFSTPKPERLIERILFLATDENDIVLDSFLGSATTSAVAHKMKRRWIGIELGEHANTHCLPRLKKVVDGEQGGISQSVNWTGGGGFKFYNLAPSLLKQDEYGNWVIDPQYNPDMLAAAMTKQEGFHYSPDESIYWKQGKSSEKDFIFTTTRFVTVEMLDKLHDEMQPDESLLVCCKSFKKECQNRHANISIKKIPQMLLGRCEFGKEDYSLNIVNLPHDEESEGIEESVQGIETVKVAVEKKKKGKKTNPGNNLELF
jgi:adenine-specific DNA-methyltransferase